MGDKDTYVMPQSIKKKKKWLTGVKYTQALGITGPVNSSQRMQLKEMSFEAIKNDNIPVIRKQGINVFQ